MMRTSITTTRDVVYATVDGEDLLADVHAPAEGAPLAAVLYFHGGGWEVGERSDYEAARAQQLAARGFLVACIQYRLAPAARFPAQRDDARAAAKWLRGYAERVGLSGVPVGAWGASAGGHLAMLLALGDPQGGLEPVVGACVAWFAPLDFEVLSGGSELERAIAPSQTASLLGGEYDRNDPLHLAANPLALVSGRAAPTLLMTGDRDRIIAPAASARMHEALGRGGASSTLFVAAGAGHEGPELETSFSLDTIAGFFASSLIDAVDPSTNH